jgi:hypothetical protein
VIGPEGQTENKSNLPGVHANMVRTPTPVAAVASAAALLAALLAALIAVSPAEGVPSPECSGARPGAVLVVPLASPIDPRPYPTVGFMFNGSDGYRYATTAGHVPLGLESGERTWGSGQGTVSFDVEGNRVGEFVYAINTRAEARPDPLPAGADLALIRVNGPGDIDNEVCGLGGPHGVDERIIEASQLVEHHWFGATVVGGRVGHPVPAEGPWLAPARSGSSIGMPSEHTVTIVGHASLGDSGAPVLSDDGLAVGWISGPPTATDEILAVGSFVVSRIGPAIERAEEVLGITLALATP